MAFDPLESLLLRLPETIALASGALGERVVLARPAGFLLERRRRTNGVERRTARMLPRGRVRLFAVPRDVSMRTAHVRHLDLDKLIPSPPYPWQRWLPNVFVIPAGTGLLVRRIETRVELLPPRLDSIGLRWGALAAFEPDLELLDWR